MRSNATFLHLLARFSAAAADHRLARRVRRTKQRFSRGNILQHGKWHFEPEDGGHVASQVLQLQPVDPVAYRMSDVWGYDEDELPIEPFDIEIRVTAPSVLEGLKVFADAVQAYMQENFGGYAREQFLERLDWQDEYAEVRICQITMEG